MGQAGMTTYNVTFSGPKLQHNKKGINRNSSEQLDKKPTVQRPRTLFCYICGREYGKASLQIHLKSCIKKFEMEEALKPIG
jgi:hypothetical protein